MLFCAPVICGDGRLDPDETCDDGNNVSGDGRMTGEHQLLATKPGFLTASKTLVFVPGKLTTYEIPHLELKAAFGMGRRWDSWIPWALLGGGGALVGLGAWSYVAAASNFAGYDVGITSRCQNRCDATTLAGFSDFRHRKDRAETEQVLVFSLFSTGGAVVIAGAIVLIMNQPRMQPEPNRTLPVVASIPGGTTVSMSWRF